MRSGWRRSSSPFWPASSFTFAKATWTQALPDWIDAHVRAFEAIGGVPELVVPDNAKTAIGKASFYDPEVNRVPLCRDGGPLPNRHPAGEAEEAARQGEGFILHPVPLKAQ